MNYYSVSKLLLLISIVHTQAYALVLNDPYPMADAMRSIYYASFTEQPKTLDPARAYSSNEYQFIAQIYEPILQYDYYLRPYKLIPLTASTMPNIRYLDKNQQPVLAKNEQDIAFSVYTITVKSGIFYQNHPAFAKNEYGHFRYLDMPANFLISNAIGELADFHYTDTRELVADDYIYQIKRLANPALSSPIYGLMSEKILGFADFGQKLPTDKPGQFIDLRKYPLKGLTKLSKYSFEITLYGQYPQFLFWLAMPFFSPIPWETDAFYLQAGMSDKNISFDWYPVGTGPFFLRENNPNKDMILQKNGNFRREFFPNTNDKEAIAAGYTQNAGKQIPLIDSAIFTLEKESIPRWSKFLQGYYDTSAIATDSFDQAIRIDKEGKLALTQSMQAKHLQLSKTTDASIYYLGFNMLDPIVGGNSERARLLRLAISIAINYEENISLFLNGRGKAAQGPIPPGIFGYVTAEQGINPYVYQWQNGKAVRRSLQDAEKLMQAAGYLGGHDPVTGKNLILHYDTTASGGPDDKAQLEWMRKQFSLIGIDLDIRATQYNRFQEKMRSGNAQIFNWGWSADYPDPENFLFMLYGKNGKVKYGGENAANYCNEQFDNLFKQMKNRADDGSRQQIINKMVALVRHDAPWIWGINSESLVLAQSWVSTNKASSFNLNQLRYIAIDNKKRQQLRTAWNQAKIWPLGLFALLLLLSTCPLLWVYHQKNCSKATRMQA